MFSQHPHLFSTLTANGLPNATRVRFLNLSSQSRSRPSTLDLQNFCGCIPDWPAISLITVHGIPTFRGQLFIHMSPTVY